MKKLITISLLLLLSLSAKKSYANHLQSSEITYKKVGDLKFEITLVIYRFCSGDSLPSKEGVTVRIGTTVATDSVTRRSIEDVKLTCDTASSLCSPQNRASGSAGGLEKHTYTDTLDFDQAKYSPATTYVGFVSIEYKRCCRPLTIGSGVNHFNFTTFNLKLANASPILTSKPLYKECCNQPVFYNMGALDSIDMDSLSYSYGNVFSSAGVTVSVSPITPYYPGSPSFPYTNPNANPPVGMYLDPSTGDFIFTPVNCSEEAHQVLEVKEWSRDSSGNRVHVGTVRRDMYIEVTSCPDNNPPTINGPFTYSVCEGDQICFNIETNDRLFVPPPPTPTPAPDTTSLNWNGGIPGASFTILDTTARLKTGRFCWTPPVGSASEIPYTFVARVQDDNCPLIAESSRAYSVTVKKRAEATTTIVAKSCNWFEVSSTIDSASFSGNASYQWVVVRTDSNWDWDPSVAFFKFSGNAVSVLANDSLKLQREGSYVVSLHINNSPRNCVEIYRDTITIGPLTTTLIDFAKDTIVCTGTDINLNSTTNASTSALDFQWYRNNNLLTDDTLTSLSILNFQGSSAVKYSVQITDSNGCTNSDHVTLHPNVPYQDSLKTNLYACQGDTVELLLDSTLLDINWSTGSTGIQQKISQSTLLSVTYTDTFGCIFNDSTQVTIHPLPIIAIKDSTYCGSSTILEPGIFEKYLWSTGDSTATLQVSKNGLYTVSVEDSLECSNSKSAELRFLYTPTVDIGQDTSRCGFYDIGTNIPSGTYLWNSGSTTSGLTVNQSGTYSVQVTDMFGCVSTDEVDVVIHPLPVQSWGDTLAFCSDDFVLISSDSFTSYRWNNGSTQRTIQAGNGSYSISVVDSLGCANKDTVHVDINPIPVVYLGSDTTLFGSGLTVEANVGTQFLWSTGETSNPITVSSSSTIWVEITDEDGCTASDTIKVTFNNNTNVPTLTRVGDSIASSLTGTHYWFLDNVATTDANANVIGINGRIGSFTAVYQDTNGCISDTSNSILRTLGIGKLSSSPLKVYPNPTNGQVTIDATALGIIKSVTLYNSQGQLVENTQSINGSKAVLQWTAGSGVYWITVTTDKGTYRAEVVNVR